MTGIRRLVGLAVLMAAGLVGCTPAQPPADPAPTSMHVSVEPLPPGETLPPEPAPREVPTVATTPAATTAGPLTPEDLPRDILGFEAQAREPAEDEYVSNGTWTHEVPGDQAGWEAVPSCPANTGDARSVPTYALAGTYADADSRLGNALVLQFSSPDDADGYFGNYLAVLDSCPRSAAMPSATDVDRSADWYAGRRDYGAERWSELVVQSGDRVLLIIVNDDHAASPEELRTAAQRLVE